jgi:membrane protease YdiL (CAAX protease family)
MAGTLCCGLVSIAVTRPSSARLTAWSIFIAAWILAAYAERGTRVGSNAVYKYSTFGTGVVEYAIWLGIVLLIAWNRFDLLALRAPRSWRRAARLAAVAVGIIIAAELVAVALPLPESPGKEQALTPTHWESAHAGAFAANFILIAVVAPFVEELTFRGEGQSLWRVFGRWPSIVIVGVTFGLAHGLIEGLIVLVPFGLALAWLRDRTDSVLPGMVVHALFNGVTLALAVLVVT